MKYRSVVPLNSAPSASDEVPRVRLHRLSEGARDLCIQLGIYDGSTIPEVKELIEFHMKHLNENQRRKLLEQMGDLLK
jgi:hypothetical protein